MATEDEKQKYDSELERVVNYKVIDNNGKTVINVKLPWPSINPNVMQLMEGLAVVDPQTEKLNFSGKFYGKYGWMITELAGISVEGKKAYWKLIVDGEEAKAGPSYHLIDLLGSGSGKSVTWKYTEYEPKKDLDEKYHPSHVLNPDHPFRKK